MISHLKGRDQSGGFSEWIKFFLFPYASYCKNRQNTRKYSIGDTYNRDKINVDEG